jgi:hypothetical protein
MPIYYNSETYGFGLSYVLGAFVKLRLLASQCLSVRTEQLGSHWTDFHKILYLAIFRKSVQKI